MVQDCLKFIQEPQNKKLSATLAPTPTPASGLKSAFEVQNVAKMVHRVQPEWPPWPGWILNHQGRILVLFGGISDILGWVSDHTSCVLISFRRFPTLKFDVQNTAQSSWLCFRQNVGGKRSGTYPE